MFWSKKKPVTEPPKRRIISEIEQAILDRDGIWVTCRVRFTKTTSWISWTYDDYRDNPVSRKELAAALKTMAYGLQRHE